MDLKKEIFFLAEGKKVCSYAHVYTLHISKFRNNMDTIAKRINDDLWVLNVMEKWYYDQIQMINCWLTDRLDKTLIPYQCTCLAHIVKVEVI